MDSIAELRDLLKRLDGEPADALESATVEFKSWDDSGSAYKSQLKEIRETAVAFANASGGYLLLGVADRKRSRADAIHGVGPVDLELLRRNIYDGTDPHLLVEIEELAEPEGRVLVIRVPRGVPPHTTSDGVARIRIGKESKPLTGQALVDLAIRRGGRDRTAAIVPQAGFDDLDPGEIQRLREMIAANDGRRDFAALGDEQLLEALALTSGPDITLAAVLLVGTRAALLRCVPDHEVIFLRRRDSTNYDFRRDLRLPLLSLLSETEQLFESTNRLTTVQPPGFQELEILDISRMVAREALLNAFVHRDYFLHQSIHVDLYPSRVEIASPGGFVGDVTPANVLRHGPVRRNPLLADVFQQLGYVNRAGLGVDRIYEETLRSGKDLPRYQADESQVTLVLPTATHDDFVRFVYEANRAGERLSLDDLIVLRGIVRRGMLDRWAAAELLQLPQQDAAERLVSLRRRGHLAAQGRGRTTAYHFADRLAHLVSAPDIESDRLWLDNQQMRRRVLDALAEDSALANADLRRITGYSRARVHQLMTGLRRDGLVELRGRGRAARYRLSDAARHGDLGEMQRRNAKNE